MTGKTLYPGDITFADELHMATLFAGRVHARVAEHRHVRGRSRAGRRRRVHRERRAGERVRAADQGPAGALRSRLGRKPGTDVVRFVGDQIALVVAETEAQARAACKLIRVEWEDLPLVLDAEEAMQPGALQLHPHSADNVCYSYRIRKGDVGARVSPTPTSSSRASTRRPCRSTPISSRRRALPIIDEEGRVTVEVAGQWTHVDQEQIAHALGLPDRAGARHLPGHRRRVRRPRGYVGADHPGAGVWRLAERGIRRPVKTHLDPRRVARSATASATR